MPSGRVAVFRAIVYLFIPLDIFVTRAMGSFHGHASDLYNPLMVARALNLPAPTETVVEIVKWGVVAAALVAATGKLPRLAGWITFALYFQWMVMAMSFGKVDHDRYAYLVALAVLPTVGRARFRDRTPSEAAGWALRSVQVSVMLTYFLASWAKFRYGGLEWVNSATLVRAVLRRGTPWTDPLLEQPEILHVAQWGIMGMELVSPGLLFLRGGRQYAAVALLLGFHLVTYATITIIFLPHVVCLASFLPLERLVPAKAQARARAAPARRIPGGRRRRRDPAPSLRG
jgi:hypothetical protein